MTTKSLLLEERRYRAMARYCLLAILAAFYFPTAAQAVETVNVTVTIIPCGVDEAVVPRLRLRRLTDSTAAEVIRAQWRRSNGLWNAKLTVPEGHYIWYVGSPHCSGDSAQWVAIPGATRHLAMAVNDEAGIIRVDENMYAAAIYGRIPVPGTTVEIMRADSPIGEQTRRVAPIDGDTYQVTHLAPGRYVLRMQFASIIATRALSVSSYKSATRADLTPQDAEFIADRQREGSGYTPVAAYDQSPGGRHTLGSASIDGWSTNPLQFPGDFSIDQQRISNAVVRAIGLAADYVQQDPRLTPPFRMLAGWSIATNVGADAIFVTLHPAKEGPWHTPGSAPAHCSLRDTHALSLIVDTRSWRIVSQSFCP